MKYDDASWHFGGDYPSDLPQENACTHTGVFLAWALKTKLGACGAGRAKACRLLKHSRGKYS